MRPKVHGGRKYLSFSILTEVAITTEPFEGRTAKFEDVQVEVLKLQSKPWTTELHCHNYWKLYTLCMMYCLPDRTSTKYSTCSTQQWCLSIENGKRQNIIDKPLFFIQTNEYVLYHMRILYRTRMVCTIRVRYDFPYHTRTV